MAYKIFKRKRGRGAARFWLDLWHAGQRRRLSLHTSDKRVAEARAAEIWRDVQTRETASALGIEDHHDTRSTPLAELLAEYHAELLRRQNTARYARQTITRIATLLDRIGATQLHEIRAEIVAKRLPELGASQTQNHYRQAISSLFRWLVRSGRWPQNPIEALRPARVVKEQERRALRAEELAALLESSPQARSLVYRVAATTGLRRAELAALSWADVDLVRGSVYVRPATEKARRGATLPVPASTVAVWRSYREAKEVWLKQAKGGARVPWRRRIAEGYALPPAPNLSTFRRDLANAAIEPGEWRVDLHALRVTYITGLARAGVGLVQAQKLARHSDPKLTATIYSHLDLADGHRAVAALDLVFSAPSQASDLRRRA